MNSRPTPSLKVGFREQQEQENLKEQYGIEEKEVVVVERKSRVVQIWRVTLRYFVLLLKVLASVLVAVLAVIGLATLIYPGIRAEFFATANQVIVELRAYTGL